MEDGGGCTTIRGVQEGVESLGEYVIDSNNDDNNNRQATFLCSSVICIVFSRSDVLPPRARAEANYVMRLGETENGSTTEIKRHLVNELRGVCGDRSCV